MQFNQRYLLTFLILSFLLPAHSQHEADKWIFDFGAGLDFSTNPPSNISSNTRSTTSLPTSIADAAGNLLFYTNGSKVWTPSNTVMANGTGLNGGLNGWANITFIAQKPGSSNLYYIFSIYSPATSSPTAGLYYSVVDMSLASGQGSVTVKNVFLLQGSFAARLTGTRHCNGTDLWILARTCSYTNTNVWNGIYDFKAFQLSSAGVNTLATTTTFTYAYGAEYSLAAKGGQTKFSPDGKKLAVAHAFFSEPYNSNVGTYEIYDFDNSTGIVSNRVELYKQPSPTFVQSNSYGPGIEFSPDCSKLYGTLSNNVHYPNGAIIQFDLCSGNNYSVDATQITLLTPTNFTINGFTDLQLAPNGKIYAHHYNMSQDSISVINFPNTGGAACGFSFSSQPIGPLMYWGRDLPSFPSDMFFLRGSVPGFSTSVISNTTGCRTIQFQSPYQPGDIVGTCPANTFTVQSLQWNFGDPSTGPNNLSSSANPIHVYSTSGSYNVGLYIKFIGCAGLRSFVEQSLVVTNPAGGTVVFSPSLTCYGANTGTASYVNPQIPNLSYQWTNGLNTFTNQTVANLSAGNWSFVVTNTISGCRTESVFTITQPTELQASIDKPYLCAGGILTATASGGTPPLSYNWQSGSTSSVDICNIVGSNTLAVTDSFGCQKIMSFVVNPTPTVLCRDTTICAGGVATLVPSGALSYTWSLGSVPSVTAVVIPTVTNSYIVAGVNQYGCLGTKTVNVKVNPLPDIKISSTHTSICVGESATLTASGAETYTWLPGQNNTVDLVVSPPSTNIYFLEGTGPEGCKSVEQSFYLPVFSSPTLKTFSYLGDSICMGAAAIISASGAESYTWEPGHLVASYIEFLPVSDVIYTLTGISSGCKTQILVPLYVTPCRRPALGLANFISKPVLTNSKYYAMDFKIPVANLTSLYMSQFLLNENLTETFPGPCTFTITSSPVLRPGASLLKINPAFDGFSDIRLTLPEESNLQQGIIDTVCFSLLLEPRNFYGLTKNSVIGSAYASNGLATRDSSSAGLNWDPDGDGDPANNNIPTPVDILPLELFIPEGFTPNGDGVYDMFIIKGLQGREVKFTVFNRWGNKVYSIEGSEITWDGTANAKGVYLGNGKLPPATYFYILDFTDGTQLPIKGFVVMQY